MLLEGANNPVEFELLKFQKTVDMDTDDGKLAYLRKGISVLSGLKNPLERELYAAKLAEEAGVTRDTVLTQVNSLVAKQKRIAEKRQWNEIQSGRQLYQDRVNPQRVSHLKQALAEEGIILYLFKNPDSYDYVTKKLKEDYFVTDFNRKIFSLLLEKLKNSPKVDLSMLSGDLTPEEMGKVSGILAKNHEIVNNQQQLDDYMNILIDYAASLRPKDLAQSDEETLKRYYEQLKKKKK